LDGSRAVLNLDSNVIGSGGSKGSQEKQLELREKCCLLQRDSVEKKQKEQLVSWESFGDCDMNLATQVFSLACFWCKSTGVSLLAADGGLKVQHLLLEGSVPAASTPSAYSLMHPSLPEPLPFPCEGGLSPWQI